MAMCGHCGDPWKVGHKCESGQAEIHRGVRHHFLRFSAGEVDNLASQKPEISTVGAQGVTNGPLQQRPASEVLRASVKALKSTCFAADRHSEKCKSCGRRRDRAGKSLQVFEPYRQCRKALALEKEERRLATAAREAACAV